MLKTFRTTHGFGVHSPFAYEMATSVLRGRACYYALEKLDELFSPSPRIRTLGRLLFKLALKFKPSAIEIYGEKDAYIQHVVVEADNNLGQERNNLKLLFFTGLGGIGEKWREFYEALQVDNEYIAVIRLSNSRKERLAIIKALNRELKHGMTFLARNRLMIVASFYHLPRQNYKMRF